MTDKSFTASLAQGVPQGFLAGGGHMGQLMATMDWSQTPLGPLEKWPQSLRTTVSLCLASNFPINIVWGHHCVQIYNDGYWPICGGKHPKSMGQDFRECWRSAWPAVGDAFERAKAGETSFIENARMFLDRHGYLEETFFTFSFSPIRDEGGNIAGLFHPVTETTAQMINERRTRALRDLAGVTTKARSAAEACQLAAAVLTEYPLDLPFSLIYLCDEDGTQLCLKGTTGLRPESKAAPNCVVLSKGELTSSIWPVIATAESMQPTLLTDLESRFDQLCCGPNPETLKAAMLLPISGPGTKQLAGLMIAGISTRRPLDDNYRGFLDLLAGSVATALSHARAYEEERKRAEALAAIDKAKTAFFSNVSHEFRTPLTLMIGPLESILNADGAASSQVREQVEAAHRNSLRLLKLVNSLLDFSRIEAGRIKALYEAVDLSSLTEDLASNFRSAMVAGGLDLIVECSPLRERVYIDREMWEKIVLNLLSNAFKFTFEGRVHVTLREEGGQAVLSVRDSGVGIPADELPHIFERFHRVEGARGRTYEGSGIGLALIQELVKLHGGTIAVDSEVNKGSVFTVAIPFGTSHLPQDRINSGERGRASTAVRAEAFSGEALTWVARDRLSDPSGGYLATAPTAANSAHARILLADDNADMREHVTRVLGTGYEVIAVNDGDAALKAARDTRPDLVISDVMMPGLDGFGFLRALRSDRELCEVPVILLSARAGEEARTEGITAGADDYLTKPFAATELVARVETTLNLQRLRQEARDEIARSERQFRAFVTATSDVIYRMSPDWREMRHLQGRNFIADTDEANRSWIEKYIPPEDRASVMSAIHQAIEGKRPFELEHRVIRVDGSTGWTFSRAVPLTDARGEIVEWFGTARDITARKRTELELHRANQALEQFAYTASHDFQEPLRTLKVYSELLTQRTADLDKESRELLDFIRSGASRMEAMVRDLLTYTQASLVDTPTGPVDASASLRTAPDNLAGAIAETGATVESGTLPFLPVHETHLQHLFQNLVGNAIKYRRPDVAPQIRILAQRCADGWQFSVSDNGIGIPPEYHERIFRIFERLHKRSESSGTGIGLSICQRIVERYHGRIWVESQTGTGATFRFILPA